MKLLKVILIQLLITMPLLPCSIFSYKDTEGIFLSGNEDYLENESSIRFVPPTDDTYGYALLGVNGYLDSHPQIAINTQGLAVDWATVPRGIYKRNKKKKDLNTPLIPELMKSCSNLEDVKKLVDSYNIDHFSYEHLMVADSSGASVVIEWDGNRLNYIEGSDDYLLVTNFNLFDGDPMECDRYMNGGYILNTSKESGFKKIVKTLDVMSQKGEATTLYSYIFNLEVGDIYIFNRSDYSRMSKINLNNIMIKAPLEIDIRDLSYGEANGF